MKKKESAGSNLFCDASEASEAIWREKPCDILIYLCLYRWTGHAVKLHKLLLRSPLKSFSSSETELRPCYREGFHVSGLVFGREGNLYIPDNLL